MSTARCGRWRGRRAAVLALCCLAACATPPHGPSGPAGRAGPQRWLEWLDAEPQGEAEAPARVLLVSIAGLTAGASLGDPAAPAGARMPTLRKLAEAGLVAEHVESVVPAAAYPVHTTLVSGRAPAGHAIAADQRLGERNVRATRYWDASLVRGPTLWQAAAVEGMSVAALDWPATLGAAIPLLLPDVLPVRRGETWLDLLARDATPWLHEQAVAHAAPGAEAAGPARDAFLAQTACTLLSSPAPPRLLLLRLSQTEPALQRSGPYGAEALDAFARADAELASLLQCLEAAGRLEETALVVSGDRVFVPVHSAIHANATLAESGLLGGSSPWRAITRSNGGSAFLYARDAEAAVAARVVLEKEVERTRAFRIVSAEEMIQLGADPEAWFGLEAEPGYVFLDEERAPRLGPSPLRAAAGYLSAEASPAFVAFGRGLRRGLRIPMLRQTDVAPTVALLLGVELAGAEGRPLVGALRLPEQRRRIVVREPEK